MNDFFYLVKTYMDELKNSIKKKKKKKNLPLVCIIFVVTKN